MLTLLVFQVFGARSKPELFLLNGVFSICVPRQVIRAAIAVLREISSALRAHTTVRLTWDLADTLRIVMLLISGVS